jgi:hypothetical protein
MEGKGETAMVRKGERTPAYDVGWKEGAARV